MLTVTVHTLLGVEGDNAAAKGQGTLRALQVLLLNTCCTQVGYSAILFYGYVGVLGLLLYACLRWWFKSKVSLPQVWCIYGKHLCSKLLHSQLSQACLLWPQIEHRSV